MIVRRYRGSTEQEATETAKRDLGASAVVLLSKRLEHSARGAEYEVVAAASLLEEFDKEIDADDGATMWDAHDLSGGPGVAPAESDAHTNTDSADTRSYDSPTARGVTVPHRRVEPAPSAWMSKMGREAYGRDRAAEVHDLDSSATPLLHLLRESLRSQEMEEELLESLLGTIRQQSSSDSDGNVMTAAAALARGLTGYVQVANGDSVRSGAMTVAMIGPTGVGKTTTIAKLAAHFHFRERRPVLLANGDTTRIGADAQLGTYSRILDIPMVTVTTPAALERALARQEDGTVCLLDTPGTSPRDRAQMGRLREFLDVAGEVQTHLTVSCTTRTGDLWEIARGFNDLRPTSLIFTKMDETATFGSVVSFAHRLGTPIAYFATGQTVPDALETATLERLVQFLLSQRHSYYC